MCNIFLSIRDWFITLPQWLLNLSSIVTLFLFVLYVIGHIWKVAISKYEKFEKFEVNSFDDNKNEDDYDNVIRVDDVGQEFILSSSYGIRKVDIYNVVYDLQNDGTTKMISKRLVSTYKNLNINEELFVRCDLGEMIPKIHFEIRRTDYAKVSFDIYSSGKNGHILTTNYKFKMTLKGWIYYLCI